MNYGDDVSDCVRRVCDGTTIDVYDKSNDFQNVAMVLLLVFKWARNVFP